MWPRDDMCGHEPAKVAHRLGAGVHGRLHSRDIALHDHRRYFITASVRERTCSLR